MSNSYSAKENEDKTKVQQSEDHEDEDKAMDVDNVKDSASEED